MKIDRIVLDKAEADWFSRNVLKTITLLEAQAAKDPKTLERRTYKVCNSLKQQATETAAALQAFGDEPFEIELIVKPKQREGVAAIIEMTIRSLEEKVIPTYVQKGLKDYEEATKRKVTLLKSMQRKFK